MLEHTGHLADSHPRMAEPDDYDDTIECTEVDECPKCEAEVSIDALCYTRNGGIMCGDCYGQFVREREQEALQRTAA
jgi:hypothetical protein